jgi:hypothetical protein
MPCLSVYATADEYAGFFCMGTLTAAEEAQIDVALQLVASDISAALAATNSCDCTWDDWATQLFAKISIIEAAVFHRCPCGRVKLSDATRQNWLVWATQLLEKIRAQEIPVCAGATAKDFPWGGWISTAWTEWSAAEILRRLTIT